MIRVTVCVGSSCHVRGSYDIIKAFERVIEEKDLADRVALEGSFCMDKCAEVANIRIDDTVHGVHSVEEAMALFAERVLIPLGVPGGMNDLLTVNDTCTRCQKCVRACPVYALGLEQGRIGVRRDRCIGEGVCVDLCPQRAIGVRDDVERVRGFIRSGDTVIASLSDGTCGSPKAMGGADAAARLKGLGFSEIVPVAEAFPHVLGALRQQLAGTEGPLLIGSCAAGVLLVTRHFPEYASLLAPVVSPPVAHGRLLKAKHGGPDVRVVHVTPCLARKLEIEDPEAASAVDAVLTFAEVERWLAEAEGEGRHLPEEDDSVVDGGILEGCVRVTVSGEAGAVVVGPRSAKEFLKNLPLETSRARAVELLPCPHGYARCSLFARADAIDSDPPATGVSFGRSFKAEPADRSVPPDALIRKVLFSYGIHRDEDRLDCGACGYATCAEHAIAILQGMSDPHMCIPFARRSVAHHRFIVEHSPNLVVLVNEGGVLLYANASFQKAFPGEDEPVTGKPFRRFFDSDVFERVAAAGEPISGKMVLAAGAVYRAVVFPIEGERLYAGIFIDVSAEETARAEVTKLRNETISKAGEVITRQMHTAQQIAGLLGETTAETKSLLHRLVELVREEEEM